MLYCDVHSSLTHVTAKEFLTCCSNPEIMEVMWEKLLRNKNYFFIFKFYCHNTMAMWDTGFVIFMFIICKVQLNLDNSNTDNPSMWYSPIHGQTRYNISLSYCTHIHVLAVGANFTSQNHPKCKSFALWVIQTC